MNIFNKKNERIIQPHKTLDLSNKNFVVSAKSIIGTREIQEDSYYAKTNDNFCLAIVSDGMGGLESGEFASRFAVETFKKMILDNYQTQDISALMLKTLKTIDRQLVDIIRTRNGNKTMGATLVSLIIYQNKIYWISVGDSRLYLIRDNKIVQLTEDHNYSLILNHLLETDKISRINYRKNIKNGKALISYLGLGDMEYYSINKRNFLVSPGDQFILCSDGLSDKLTNQEILANVISHKKDKEIANSLLNQMQDISVGENQDNTTVIYIKII